MLQRRAGAAVTYAVTYTTTFSATFFMPDAQRCPAPTLERASASDGRFAYGGVAFEVLPDALLAPALELARQRYSSSLPHPAANIDAVCSVRLDLALAIPESDALVSWRATPEGVSVRGTRVRAEIRPTAARRYVITARIGAPDCVPLLLTLLASTLVDLEGGLHLHATALEIEGEAVLLLGPSGAGKSTAAGQLDCARCLSDDRVTVVRSDADASFWVWSLPGGSAATLPVSGCAVLPLGAFLRVRQSDRNGRVQPVAPARGALLLREAVEVAFNSDFREAARLAIVSDMACVTAAAEAHIVLGQTWSSQLQGFLNARCARPGAEPIEPGAGTM
jgi:hypothetical protein